MSVKGKGRDSMMKDLSALTKEVMEGRVITKEEALELYDHPLEELCDCADQIRRHFCGDQFHICTIINGKSGHCSENCKFCAQSAHNHTCASEYPCFPMKRSWNRLRSITARACCAIPLSPPGNGFLIEKWTICAGSSEG